MSKNCNLKPRKMVDLRLLWSVVPYKKKCPFNHRVTDVFIPNTEFCNLLLYYGKSYSKIPILRFN